MSWHYVTTTPVTCGRSHIRQSHSGPAWRVSIPVKEGDFLLPIPFGAEADARAAAAWLEARLPVSRRMSCKQYDIKFRAIAGTAQKTCDLIVAECCRW